MLLLLLGQQVELLQNPLGHLLVVVVGGKMEEEGPPPPLSLHTHMSAYLLLLQHQQQHQQQQEAQLVLLEQLSAYILLPLPQRLERHPQRRLTVQVQLLVMVVEAMGPHACC